MKKIIAILFAVVTFTMLATAQTKSPNTFSQRRLPATAVRVAATDSLGRKALRPQRCFNAQPMKAERIERPALPARPKVTPRHRPVVTPENKDTMHIGVNFTPTDEWGK